MSTIDVIKERLDIVDVIGSYLPLQKAGRNFKANCPFHNERTPSFVVFPESQRWRCFGACNEGGDVFNFVMKREGWDFGEALARLAERAGVELEPRSGQAAAEAEAHERLRAALTATATYYHHLLLHTPAAAGARAYAERRGLAPETLERFQIGFAPESWDAARGHLTARGFTPDELVLAGVLTRNPESGAVYDRFRNRLIIPIRDTQGRVIAFGARALGEQEPKYLNSPQSPIFDKGSVLFALDLARRAIRQSELAVIVEGYLDAISAHQAGFSNVVAQMGTALTETQLRTLKRYARRFVLALDADAAGASATLRGLAVARETLEHSERPVFDPQGLLRFEGRLQADIRVLTLPAGRDPDEVIRADPADWRRRVDEALPIVEYVLGRLTAGRDLGDPKVKAEVSRQILPLIGDVVDPVERDGYIQKLARLLRVDEHAMRGEVRLGAGGRGGRGAAGRGAGERAAAAGEAQPIEPRRTQARGSAASAPARFPGAEAACLGVLLHSPYLLAAADQMLVGAGLDVLSSDDFENGEHRQLFQVIRQYDITEPPDWEARCHAALHARLAELRAVELPARGEDEDLLREELLGLVVALRDRQLQMRGQQLQLLVREASELGQNESYAQYKAAQREHAAAVNRLRALRAGRTRYAAARGDRRGDFLL
jgi:DNA primase